MLLFNEWGKKYYPFIMKVRFVFLHVFLVFFLFYSLPVFRFTVLSKEENEEEKCMVDIYVDNVLVCVVDKENFNSGILLRIPNYIEKICKKYVLKNNDCTTLKNHLTMLEKQRIDQETAKSKGCYMVSDEGTCLVTINDVED